MAIYATSYAPNTTTHQRTPHPPLFHHQPRQAAAKEDGSGSKLSASTALNVANAGEGLYVVFENLLGAPVTFSNAQVGTRRLLLCVYAWVSLSVDTVRQRGAVWLRGW